MEKIKKYVYDDLEDGEVEADTTHQIGFDGEWRTIDLTNKNEIRLNVDFVEKYFKKARLAEAGSHKAPRVKGVNMARSSGYNSEQLVAIREWGRRNGWPNISSKGKVAREVIAAFEDNAGAEVVVPEPQFSAT